MRDERRIALKPFATFPFHLLFSTSTCFLLMPYKYLKRDMLCISLPIKKIDLHCYRSEVSIVLHANVFVYLCKDTL